MFKPVNLVSKIDYNREVPKNSLEEDLKLITDDNSEFDASTLNAITKLRKEQAKSDFEKELSDYKQFEKSLIP